MSVQFQLVSGEETLIEHRRDDNLSNYINQNWTGSQLQKFLDDRVGTANYDVGHLFHNTTNPNGNAGCIGCVCDDNSKGKAFSAGNLGSMDIDRFDIDFFCHELGHQMGANHTHNLQNENYRVQVKPGNGSTIMGYAEITGKLTFSFIPFTSNTPFVLIPAAPACSAARAISGMKLPFSIYKGSPGNA